MNKVVVLLMAVIIGGVALLVFTVVAGYGFSKGVMFPVAGIALLALGFWGLARSTWGSREGKALEGRQNKSSHWADEFKAREGRYPSEKEYVDWLRIHGDPEERRAVNWMYRGHLE